MTQDSTHRVLFNIPAVHVCVDGRPSHFVVFCVFVFLFCSHWSLVDVPLIFFCPADHVPDWQPRILLGMVEARSVNVKKTTTTTTILMNNFEHRVFRIEPINTAVHNRCINLGWSVEKNGALYGAGFAPR